MTSRNAKPGDRMTEATRQRLEAQLGDPNICDRENPAFVFSLTATDLLLAINAGLIDASDLVRRELANRGLDSNGQWAGIDLAREIHLGGTTGGNEVAQAVAAEIARRHLQIECLDTRHSDAFDFHDIAAWSLRDALIAAFEAGVRQIHGRED